MAIEQLKDLNIGDKVRMGNYQVESEDKEPIIWRVAGKNHEGYPDNTVTLLTDRIIDYRAVDAKEPSNSNSDRQKYGNNRYRDSNLRQWLNKAGLDWFEKTHEADEPPTNANTDYSTEYHNKEGFLSAFDSQEIAGIADTELTVALNTVTDGGGVETVNDKIFLLSNTEVGLANEPGGAEGHKLEMFTNDTSRKIGSTVQAFNNTKSTNKPSNANSDWIWWLRSPRSGRSINVRYVYTDGSLLDGPAYGGGYGVRPALNVFDHFIVTEGEDGIYDITFNTAPSISGQDTNLGNVSDTIIYSYTVTDEDEDKLSIVERLNNNIIKTRSDVDSGSSFDITITREELYDLELGVENTIEIEVYDGTDRVYRKVKFTRSNTAPEITILSGDDRLENLTQSPILEFKVEDPEGDRVDLSMSLNDKEIATMEDIELGATLEFTVANAEWVKLEIGNHTLKIIARDSEGGESHKKINFTRAEDSIEVITSTLTTDLRVEEIIPVAWLTLTGLDINYDMEVYATNNANDESPVWEDVTSAAINGNIYRFVNDSKTAEDWGISIKVNIATE